jgi:hypothetical protein
LTETLDSRSFSEVPGWFENSLFDQVRLNVVLHEQSLLAQQSFTASARSAQVKRLKTLQLSVAVIPL